MLIINSLLLILALHFLIKGIKFRKNIYIYKEKKEKFKIVECIHKKEEKVKPSNNFADDKNDSNFESDVLDVNNFYKKNDVTTETNKNTELIQDNKSINSVKPVDSTKNMDSWKYKNEFIMNGGELLNGITGFNLNDNISGNLSSQYFINSKDNSIVDDDIRMGLGTMNMKKRLTS